MMEDEVTLPSARAAMGFGGLFISVLLVGGLLNYLLGRLVESTGLTGTDRLLGGVFGSGRGLAIVLAILTVAGFTPIPADPWWRQSAMVQRLMPLVTWMSMYLPESIRSELDFEPEVKAENSEEPDKNGDHENRGSDRPDPAATTSPDVSTRDKPVFDE